MCGPLLQLLTILGLLVFLICHIFSMIIDQHYQPSKTDIVYSVSRNYTEVFNYSISNPHFTQNITLTSENMKISIKINITQILIDTKPGSGKCFSFSEHSELTTKTKDVFSGNLRVPQDESELLAFVRKCVFTPPSSLAYNLDDPTGHSSPVEGVQKYVWSLVGNKNRGVYVECGSNVGEDSSNTLVLERDYGWSGLLIESDPKNTEKLLEKRRKAWVANACVGIHPYPYEIAKYPHKCTKPSPSLADGGFCSNGPEELSKPPFKVNCLPLYTMMAALDLKDLDYMSMGDIDGVELKVLITLPFDKIKVKVFSIKTMPASSSAVREFMHSKGYAFVKTISGKYGRDDVFAHKSLLNDTMQDVVFDANAKI